MYDDPRTKARSFLESSSIISELEDVLNHLVYEKPDDLNGYIANHFLGQSKQPQIINLTLKRLIGPADEPAIHIDLTIALRNRTERYNGITVNLLSGKLNNLTIKQLEALVNSSSLETILNRIDLFDQITIDNLLVDFRSKHADKMAKLAAIESENSNGEPTSDVAQVKISTNARPPTGAGAAKAGVAPTPSKKGAGKDLQPIEIIPDEPEPSSFAGQLLITSISLTCCLITTEIKQSNLFRLIQLSSITNLSMPLPIIPILQSGPIYPGKQSLIKYFMLIPTPHIIHNEEWIHKVHNILQFLRDSLTNAKGATLQSTYSTDDGCLVFPMDKPEQGFDLIQNAINSVCGTDEHWFDYAIQMGPYETFDYTRGRYEVTTGVVKSPDELVDVYVDLIDTYSRCIMLIDPFRYADKSSLSRLCDRISNKCYITSTDIRRYQNDNNDDNNTINCHLLSLDSAPTITELIQRMNTLHELNSYALGLFERDHQEVAQVHLADLAVGFGCRFIKLPGLLSLGGQRTSAILQRLSIIRDEIEINDNEQFARPNQHEFIHIRSPIDLTEQERIISDVEYAAAEILAINAGHYIRFALDKPVLRLYTVIYSTAWYWIVWLADVALLLLPCIERPAYFKEVPAWVALIIEIIALSILLASFILSMRLQDKRKLLREAVFPYIFAGVFLLTTIDMIIYYILIFNGHYYVRWSRPLRVLFPFALQAGQNIRRVIRNILRTLPNIGNVMFLFLFSVLTFTLLGVGILKNKKLMYPNKSEYFTHYLDTAWDLYVLTTTANNPDEEKQLIHKRQLDTLMIMFERLTKHNSNRCISYETYTCLMRAIKPHITEHIIDAYWKTLNITNKEDGLNVKQFNELLLNLNFELRQRSADQTILQKQCPSIYNSKPSRIIIDFVNTDLFRAIINLLIVGNAICLAASYNDLEWFFLSLFIVEALLKMYAIGVKEYFHHRWNIFDFTIVFVSTTYSLLTAIIKSLSLNRDVLDAILVIRVLRLVKIVGNVERFKVIFGTFSKVIPTLITYLRVMFMTYYVFAMIGMEIFQNKIVHLDSNSTSAEFCNDTRLNGSDFAKAQYCRNNFNDYLSSLILLFALTVVNQWHVLASGFVLVTSKVARLFFLAFHLCAVIVVLNIFTAFVIDSFLNQYILSKSKEFPWMEQENVIAERLTQQGYRIIRRYDNTKQSEGGTKKKFNLLEKLRAFVQPSIYRRMTVILQTMADDEHALLLQWRGDVDIDPVALLNLTNDSS
ncbi:unnamed protein product [Rotaria sp. Silwood1]|nr:unnamed protein product [Rotaria sp. Silwood1]CAF4639291.1 unnamed protein product [Rotaria sp. Silwood1]